MLTVITIPVTLFEQNARLIVEEKSGEGIFVDPGGDVPLLMEVAAKSASSISHILLTHAHLDHAGGINGLMAALAKTQVTPPVFIAHQCEALLRGRLTEQSRLFGLPSADFEDVPEPERYVVDGDRIKLGKVEAELRHTPGHSPGHLVLFFEAQPVVFCEVARKGELIETGRDNAPILLSGDTLFAGSIGRTDLFGGDLPTLIKSINDRIFVLPDSTIVLSGHGPQTTVGVERRTNPFLTGI